MSRIAISRPLIATVILVLVSGVTFAQSDAKKG